MKYNTHDRKRTTASTYTYSRHTSGCNSLTQKYLSHLSTHEPIDTSTCSKWINSICNASYEHEDQDDELLHDELLEGAARNGQERQEGAARRSCEKKLLDGAIRWHTMEMLDDENDGHMERLDS
jgi:hypothetical protein